MNASNLTPDERSIAEIVQDLTVQTGQLLRQERKLASAELDQKLSQVKVDLMALGGGIALLLVAFAGFVATTILVLARFMEAWLAAAIVTVAATSLAAGVALVLRRRATKLTDVQSLQSVKQDVKTVKEAAQDAF